MPSVPTPTGVARFGPYEVEIRTGEIRKFGTRIKLGEQPFRILLFLMEHPGELVTREELRARLWSQDTFVDFDHSLNSAVQRLRDSLSDTAEKAQWIETVPRRGYRFVGRIEWTKSNGSGTSPALAAQGEPPIVHGSKPPEETTPSLVVAVPRRGTWKAYLRIGGIAVSLLCLAGYIGLRNWRSSDKRPRAHSEHVMLAVLPFENLSGDPGEDYLSDGLTEEIISQLGALNPEHLGVISRTTSMAYKHTSKNVHQIGDELNVDYVLESSIRRDSDRLRITAQLIRTRDQVHIWAKSYDRQISASIALQEEVAKAVADQIEINLSPEYAGRPARPRSDPEANEAYLRGRFFFNQFTPEGYRKGIGYFQQAIAREPNFAEAWAGMSDCYRFLVVTDSISPGEGSPQITDAAARAVSLGEGLAESHSSLAGALMEEYDWAGAEKEFQRAIAINPSFSDAHRYFAALLNTQLRHREAWEQISEAMRTDPLSLPNNAEVVRTLYYARDYDGAVTQAKKAMLLAPDYYRIHFWLGRVYGQHNMAEKAIEEAQLVLRSNPDSNLGLTELAYSLAIAGRREEAREILHKLEERARHRFVPAYDLAVIHIALHQNDDAMRLLQQAYDGHDWALMALAVEPRLDPLRHMPQFRALLQKVGLPQS